MHGAGYSCVIREPMHHDARALPRFIHVIVYEDIHRRSIITHDETQHDRTARIIPMQLEKLTFPSLTYPFPVGLVHMHVANLLSVIHRYGHRDTKTKIHMFICIHDIYIYYVYV